MSGTDERLNGLLDGELSPAEALDTVRALRDDPALTTRLAEIANVRAATAVIDADLPPPAIPPNPARRPWRRPWTLAGGVALALSVTAAVLVLLPAREPPTLAAHRRFLGSAANATDGAASLPDLSAAGLRLTRVETVGGGTYAGYVGPSGCRLGLWIGPSAGAPAGGIGEWNSQTVARTDGQVIWIAAPAMDAERFAALAEAVRSGSTANVALLAGDTTRSACLS